MLKSGHYTDRHLASGEPMQPLPLCDLSFPSHGPSSCPSPAAAASVQVQGTKPPLSSLFSTHKVLIPRSTCSWAAQLCWQESCSRLISLIMIIVFPFLPSLELGSSPPAVFSFPDHHLSDFVSILCSRSPCFSLSKDKIDKLWFF